MSGSISVVGSTAPHPCSFDALIATFRNQNPTASLVVLDAAGSDQLDAYARTNLATGTIRVNRFTSCWVLPSVLNHELAHVRQAAAGLDQSTYLLDSNRWELAADCASYRLGSTYAPYVNHANRLDRLRGLPPLVTCDLATATPGTVPPGA